MLTIQLLHLNLNRPNLIRRLQQVGGRHSLKNYYFSYCSHNMGCCGNHVGHRSKPRNEFVPSLKYRFWGLLSFRTILRRLGEFSVGNSRVPEGELSRCPRSIIRLYLLHFECSVVTLSVTAIYFVESSCCDMDCQ